MTEYYDNLETRDPEAREAALFDRLRTLLAEAVERAPGLRRHLVDCDPRQIADRAVLATLPVLRKTDLGAMQQADPPLGGLAARPVSEFTHLFQSPGPVYEPGMGAPDWWRFARALWAGGLRAEDRVLNCFSYHLTPAGLMFDSGARAIGCTVIPGGVGNTEAQAVAAADLGATAYAGTPDFLKILIEKAEEGRALTVTKAVVGGGPLFPQIRQFYFERGVTCVQGYGTADLGSIAYETIGPDGTPNPGMVVDEGVIVEIVRPGTGDPVTDGEVGEVVVTLLNADYPLIRFATGDMSAVLSGLSPCGRTNMRIKGWMGRADQTTKVRGMFVRPEQVARIVARHPEVSKARLTVSRDADADTMTLAIETTEPSRELADAVAETMRDVLKLRGEVEAAVPGSLPNDGKVIDDVRTFD